MTVQRMAASTGLAVAVAAAGWGVAAGAGTAAAAVSGRAADASLAASPTAAPVSAQDRTFMDQASQINLTEISLGKYMHAHSTDTALRNLGARYARDHTAAQANLRPLAASLGVTVPKAPNTQLRSMVAKVESLKGKDMDVAFANISVSGHEAAIDIFKKEESAGSNAAVKAYAAKYLPMLQTHLRMAKQAESALGVKPAS
jgi:putative membrane protein